MPVTWQPSRIRRVAWARRPASSSPRSWARGGRRSAGRSGPSSRPTRTASMSSAAAHTSSICAQVVCCGRVLTAKRMTAFLPRAPGHSTCPRGPRRRRGRRLSFTLQRHEQVGVPLAGDAAPQLDRDAALVPVERPDWDGAGRSLHPCRVVRARRGGGQTRDLQGDGDAGGAGLQDGGGRGRRGERRAEDIAKVVVAGRGQARTATRAPAAATATAEAYQVRRRARALAVPDQGPPQRRPGATASSGRAAGAARPRPRRGQAARHEGRRGARSRRRCLRGSRRPGRGRPAPPRPAPGRGRPGRGNRPIPQLGSFLASVHEMGQAFG